MQEIPGVKLDNDIFVVLLGSFRLRKMAAFYLPGRSGHVVSIGFDPHEVYERDNEDHTNNTSELREVVERRAP